MGSLRGKIRAAAGDAVRILELVSEAERGPNAQNAAELSELCALAMKAIGPLPMQIAPDAYGVLCRKRLKLLRATGSEEASLFEEFMRAKGITPLETADDAGPVSPASAGVSFDSDDSFSRDAGAAPKVFAVNSVPYELLRRIGSGASAKVYEARRVDGAAGGSPQHVALKFVNARSAAQFEALANEITMLRRLKGCPHVIEVVDAQTRPNNLALHIVMELGETDLGKWLQAQPCLSLGDIQLVWRNMLEAVSALHAHRVVHSDLKPANFLFAGGRLKVIDFGTALCMASEHTHIEREKPFGTITYMAPEALKKGKSASYEVGRPSDVWSLGIILYTMVYKQSPFVHLESDMDKWLALMSPDLTIDFPPEHCLETHSPAVKSQLLDVLRRCLRVNPRERATIDELLKHDFLRLASQVVFRCDFDRQMAAMLAATRKVLLGRPGGSCDNMQEDTGDEDDFELEACLDELWASLAPSGAGLATPAPAPSLDAYCMAMQRWAARGAKRRRLADSEASPPPSAGGGPEAAAAYSAAPLREVAAAQASPLMRRFVVGEAAGARPAAPAPLREAAAAQASPPVRKLFAAGEAAGARPAAPSPLCEAAAAQASPPVRRLFAAGEAAGARPAAQAPLREVAAAEASRPMHKFVVGEAAGARPARPPGPLPFLKELQLRRVRCDVATGPPLERVEAPRAAPSSVPDSAVMRALKERRRVLEQAERREDTTTWTGRFDEIRCVRA